MMKSTLSALCICSALTACGSSNNGRPTPTAPMDPAASNEKLPSLDLLAVQARAESPGMHAKARHEDIIERARTINLIEPRDGDLCLRVTFAASDPVSAQLESDNGIPRSERIEGTKGTFGARGSLCVSNQAGLRLSLTPVNPKKPITVRTIVLEPE